MIFLKQYASVSFLFCVTVSAIPWVKSVGLTLELPKIYIANLLGGSPSSQSKDLIHLGKHQDNSSMGRETQFIAEELKSELEEIKEMLNRLNNNNLRQKVEDIYLTKVGVHKPIISDSSIKVEYMENREKDKPIPRDCLEVLENGNNISGVYQIQPVEGKEPFMVLCDMDIRGGGWTHIQKRFDGSVDFLLGWREYKLGFGDLLGEFWTGLEHIHWLTNNTQNQLLIEIVDRENVSRYAEYDAFGIGPESDGYQLDILSGYRGDAVDSLSPQRGMKFSTIDFDQDRSERDCAESESGGWWFDNCGTSNLNGKFINIDNMAKGVQWHNPDKGATYSYAKVRMLVKPVH